MESLRTAFEVLLPCHAMLNERLEKGMPGRVTGRRQKLVSCHERRWVQNKNKSHFVPSSLGFSMEEDASTGVRGVQ